MKPSRALPGNVGADDNGVLCLDPDGDGDFDAMIPTLSGDERYLENDGSGNFTRVADAFEAWADPSLWVEAGDVNGDGFLDLVTGQGEGSPNDNQVWLGTRNQTADTRGPHFRGQSVLQDPLRSGDNHLILRAAVTDRAMSDRRAPTPARLPASREP